MKNNTFKEYIAPVIVLVCICLGMSLALAVVYGITKPIIDTNSKAAADATRGALLPEAEKQFAVYDGDLVVEQENAVYVSECYVAENKSGMVCTVVTKSFGGALTMMVGINSEGAVTGVAVTNHADTPGLGTKDFEADYLDESSSSATAPTRRTRSASATAACTASRSTTCSPASSASATTTRKTSTTSPT